MEWYVILILVLAAPVLLLPVALIWYLNIAGTIAWLKARARVRLAASKRVAEIPFGAIVPLRYLGHGRK